MENLISNKTYKSFAVEAVINSGQLQLQSQAW